MVFHNTGQSWPQAPPPFEHPPGLNRYSDLRGGGEPGGPGGAARGRGGKLSVLPAVCGGGERMHDKFQ